MGKSIKDLYNALTPTMTLLLDEGFGVEAFHDDKAGYGFIARKETFTIRVLIFYDRVEEQLRYMLFQEKDCKIIKQIECFNSVEVFNSIVAILDE